MIGNQTHFDKVLSWVFGVYHIKSSLKSDDNPLLFKPGYFLLADLSSGYNDSMIEVVTGMVPISFNCLSISQI